MTLTAVALGAGCTTQGPPGATAPPAQAVGRAANNRPEAAATDWIADLRTAEPQAGPTGTLALRFVLPASQAAGLRNLEAHPLWGGSSRGPDRRLGWHRVPPTTAAVRLTAAPVTAAVGPVPAGHYALVFAAAPRIDGSRADGGPVTITSHVEPVHLAFDLAPGTTATVDLELIVLPAPGGKPNAYEIFVKSAALNE